LQGKYFFDSYTVLAFLSGSPSYQKYLEENEGYLTKLNLLEIFYRTLEEYGLKAASDIVSSFSKYVVDFDLEDIANSMKLRLELKRKGLDISYADALGYYLARKIGVRFLTGDSDFENLKGVEFVQ
jgi:predicted nucleic acid-binding protein